MNYCVTVKNFNTDVGVRSVKKISLDLVFRWMTLTLLIVTGTFVEAVRKLTTKGFAQSTKCHTKLVSTQ